MSYFAKIRGVKGENDAVSAFMEKRLAQTQEFHAELACARIRYKKLSSPSHYKSALHSVQVLMGDDPTPNPNPISLGVQLATFHFRKENGTQSLCLPELIIIDDRINYSQYNLAGGPRSYPHLSPKSHIGRKVRRKKKVTIEM